MILSYILVLDDYLWCSYLLVLNFILKIFMCLFFHNFFFFILIKSNKQVDTIDPFNKWVMLGLRNLELFNKHVGLVLTYIVGYSWVNMTWTRHTNTNCLPYAGIYITCSVHISITIIKSICRIHLDLGWYSVTHIVTKKPNIQIN